MRKVKPARNLDRKPRWIEANAILCCLFIISLALVAWGISIYRVTVIEAKYLVVACVLGAAVGNLLISIFLTGSYSWISNVSLRSTIGASIFYFSVLFLNQQFTSKSLVTAEFPIIEKGSLAKGKGGRCPQPYVIIDFHGKLKQLIYYCDKEEEIRQSQKVIIQYSKGALGFYVVESSQLVG